MNQLINEGLAGLLSWDFVMEEITRATADGQILILDAIA